MAIDPICGMTVDEITVRQAVRTMTIVPSSGKKLSPKAIWEAIEQAGKKPAKLVGPDGEFVAKPNS